MTLSTIRIVLACCLAYVALANRDYDVCDIITESCGLIPPPLPQNYEMKTGITHSDKKSLAWEEYYFDYTNLKAKYIRLSEGYERHYIFDYETEQIVKYDKLHPGTNIKKDPLSDTCKVERMETSNLRFIFGYRYGQFPTKHSRMYNSYEALRFGGEYQYAANGTVELEARGLTANQFVGCIYDSYADVTEKISYAFTTEKVMPAGGMDNEDDTVQNTKFLSLPLAVQYNGVMHVEDKKIPHEGAMHISWFKAEPDFKYDTFKIPPWLYCDGYTRTKPMPKFPSAFSARVEMSVFGQDMFGKMTAAEIIKFDQIFYNYDKQLARRDFTPVKEIDGEILTKFENNGPVKEIYDFNDGVAYVIHKKSGRCFPRSIKEGDYFETVKETMWVMMATPEELYNLDPKGQEYKGKNYARDIETDVWIGKTFDKGINQSIFRETYFSTNGWHEEANDLTEYGVPVRQTVITSKEIDGDFIQSISETNFFKFKIAEPPVMMFEVSGCVEELKHKFLVITLSIAPKDEEFINSNRWYFQQSMQYYIAKVSEIGTPLRVQRVKLQSAKDKYFLTFAFVDKALKSTGQRGLTIEKAIDLLYSFIERGKFELKFIVPGEEERRVTGDGLFEIPGGDKKADNKVAKVSTYLQSPRREIYAFLRDDTKKIEKVEKKGMSPGGLAGLAIAMLLIGAGIGVGVMCFYVRRYDTTRQNMFSMKG